VYVALVRAEHLHAGEGGFRGGGGTLNPKLSALNPKPLNLRPLNVNPKPQFLNPKPQV